MKTESQIRTMRDDLLITLNKYIMARNWTKCMKIQERLATLERVLEE